MTVPAGVCHLRILVWHRGAWRRNQGSGGFVFLRFSIVVVDFAEAIDPTGNCSCIVVEYSHELLNPFLSLGDRGVVDIGSVCWC